ncbi:acid protease [Peniophora sp. CONT]|nr:acid protease [Peniophora sp. CONT]
MSVIVRLVVFLTLALAGAASPVVTESQQMARLSLTQRTTASDIMAKGRAHYDAPYASRALVIRDTIAHGAPLVNSGIGYTATISVGEPPQTFQVHVDTSTPFTWVGGNTTYRPSETSIETDPQSTVHYPYGIGSINATLYTDKVTLGDLTVPNQTIGVATGVDGITGDGVLGIGGSFFPLTGPSFTDNLDAQGTVYNVALSFEPSASGPSKGELSFGDVDSSKYFGSITYTSGYYWAFNQSIAYDSSSILTNGAGIVHSLTPYIFLATDAFVQYKDHIGAQLDSTNNLYTITAAQYQTLKSLYFNIGGTKFELTPNAQILPRISPNSSEYYLAVNDMSALDASNASGLDFVLGYSFLERFYTVLDTDNGRIGFATTSFTNATFN